ncbi:MAG: TolC family protein [Candidatus Binatia bacterium]
MFSTTVIRARARVRRVTAAALGVAGLLPACSLAPKGAAVERARVEAAGAPYADPGRRQIPELPAEPDWRDLLRHAFLSNGELEAGYYGWRAAVERIDIAAGYPNTNVSLGFEYLFAGGNLTGWDRTTLTVGFDPMQNLSFPTKVLAAGRVAYEEARAAGERFAAAKFALQRRVIDAYLDYALLAERVRAQREQLDLLRVSAETAAAQVIGGMPQQALLAAQVEVGHAEHLLRDLEAEQEQQRIRLNALIGRAADAPLPAPRELPTPRPLPVADRELVAAGTAANPELRALSREVASRDDALELARQQYFPDINPFVGITGSIGQVVGAAISLSTRIPQIQAGIREARANLQAARAVRRQAGGARGAEFVGALIALRNSERQVALLREHIIPVANQSADTTARAYAAGSGDLPSVIAARRTLLVLRVTLAETQIARERAVAELEQLAGIDAEALPAALARLRANPPAPTAGDHCEMDAATAARVSGH